MSPSVCSTVAINITISKSQHEAYLLIEECPTEDSPSVFQLALRYFGLVGLTVLVFAPVMQNGFVNYDDGAYVTENEFVSAGLNRDSIVWAFRFESTRATGNWHPLTWISLMADVSLFGVSAGPMHIVNVVIHIANVLLLYTVFRQMTRREMPSWIVAAIFAVHPLHVESVAWVSERKDVLSTLFCLSAIYCHFRRLQTLRIFWLAAALCCYLLSLMAKQMYVTLPFILLLIDYWPLGRGITKEPDLQEHTRWPQTTWRKLVVEKIPFLCIALLFCGIAFLGQRHGGAVGSLARYPPLERVVNAVVSYGEYVRLSVFPFGLSVFYPYPAEPRWGAAVVSGTFLSMVTWLSLKNRQRWPEIVVGWLWFLGTLVPVIGFVQIGAQRMADRYMYFPLIGLTLMLVFGVCRAVAPFTQSAKALAAICLPLIIIYAGLAHQQTKFWADSETLFGRAADVAESSLAFTKLGYERAQGGDYNAAVNLLHKALRLDPDYVAAHNSLGNVCLAEGNPLEAMKHFQAAIRLEPSHAEAHYNLGIIFLSLNEADEAMRHFQESLILNPNNADAHTNMAAVKIQQQRISDALKHLQAALQLEPEKPEANYTLAGLLASLDRNEEAITHFQIALKSGAQAAAIHRELSELYRKVGEFEQARRHAELATEGS